MKNYKRKMIEQEKQLLLADLCARLPYNVRIRHYVNDIDFYSNPLMTYDIDQLENNKAIIKPYLRLMSSMTEEEKKEYDKSYDIDLNECANSIKRKLETNDLDSSGTPMFNHIDWLNAHHFDYRGLIDEGLAIAVTDDNNPYKE